jgi:hypothetical protein
MNEAAMRKYILPLLMLAGMISGLLSCSTQQITQEEITAFINDFEKKAEFIDHQIARYQWDYYTDGERDSLDYYRRARNQITGNARQLTLIKTYLSLVNDETAKRKLELIYRQYRRSVTESEKDIEQLIGSIVSAYDADRDGSGRRSSDVGRESNRGQRRVIYAELMEFGNSHAEDVALVARKRNHLISRIGYNSYYDFMLAADGIARPDFMNLLEQLDQLSADIYRTALDSLKNALGFEDIRIWDIEYALYDRDQLTAQYFGAGQQKSLLESTLGGLGFRLRALPIYLTDFERRLISPRDDVLGVKIPDDIRVPLNLEDGVHSLQRLFAQAGKAIYATQIEPDDYLRTQPPAPCYQEAMGRIISGLTELSAWKRKYAGMPEPAVIESAMRRNFRRLFNLRLALVNIYFEREMYSDPFADLQQVYAGLFEKYMMFPLGGDFRPWAAEIHYLTDPVTLQNRLIAECIAAQTYHYLTEKYGAVLDDQHTREFLVQNFYRFGARDDWQTLLTRGTGEKLNAAYYFDFPGD